MIITIDGPSGSGKSTLARLLAHDLGMYYLNTGLLYRALAFLVFDDPAGACYKRYDADLQALTTAQLPDLELLQYRYHNGQAIVFIRDVDVTRQLYALPGLDQRASRLSALPIVRQLLLDFQRDFARRHDVIADGRDCGSVVFPHADVKFFLTASLDARAQRRLADAKAKQAQLTFEHVRSEIELRDARDQARAAAPLIVPDGALEIDSSGMSIQQVKDLMEQRIVQAKKGFDNSLGGR